MIEIIGGPACHLVTDNTTLAVAFARAIMGAISWENFSVVAHSVFPALTEQTLDLVQSCAQLAA